MKKRWIAAIVLTLAAIGFFAIAPGRVEQSLNRLKPQPLRISPAAQKLHATLDVADLHADSLLWKRDLIERSEIGKAHV